MMGFLGVAGAVVFMVFFFSLCIFVHELGHFLAAKWRGLHIVAFSLGFKKIWGYKHKGVEYRLGWIPFGGYVDLPQLDASGENCKLPDGTVLSPAKPFDRAVTAFAGPLFNIIFGLFLGIFIWVWGIPQDTPKMTRIIVAAIDEKSPEYEAGLRKDDVIVDFKGKPFNCTWSDFVRTILFTVGKVDLGVIRDGQSLRIQYQPKENPEMMPKEKLAFPFFKPKIPVVLYPYAGSPAKKSGVKNGDIVLKLNGKDTLNCETFQSDISESKGLPQTLLISRDGRRITLENVIPEKNKERPGVYRIGVKYTPELPITVESVLPGSPASAAGFVPGDVITAINGTAVADVENFALAIQNSGGKPLALKINRGGAALGKEIIPVWNDLYDIGVRFAFFDYPNPAEQFVSVISMTYKSLRGVFTGLFEKMGLTDQKSSLKARHFSGPIGIGRIIYISVYHGSLIQGLHIIVIITFSLALLNLFPAPVLDGGHIAMALIEMVVRRPLPPKLIQPVTFVFVALLISFMLFVSFFDVMRLIPDKRAPPKAVRTEAQANQPSPAPPKDSGVPSRENTAPKPAN
jgi:RIP metalloprotease RseP